MNEEIRELIAKLRLYRDNGQELSSEIRTEVEKVLGDVDWENTTLTEIIGQIEIQANQSSDRPEFETTALNQAKLGELLAYLQEHERLKEEEKERVAEMVARMIEDDDQRVNVAKIIERLRELRERDMLVMEQMRQEKPEWSDHQLVDISRIVSLKMTEGESEEEVKTSEEIWETAKGWIEGKKGVVESNREEVAKKVADRIRLAVQSNDFRIADLATELREVGVEGVDQSDIRILTKIVEGLAIEKSSLETKRAKIRRESMVALAEENPNLTSEQVVREAEMVAELSGGEEAVEGEARQKIEEGENSELVLDSKVLTNLLVGKQKIETVLKKVEGGYKVPERMREIRATSDLIENLKQNPELLKLMETVRKMTGFDLRWANLAQGLLKKVGEWTGREDWVKMAENFGRQKVIRQIMTGSISILGRRGLSFGSKLKMIGTSLVRFGSKATAAKTRQGVTKMGLSSVLVKIGGASAGPIAWVVMGVGWVAKKLVRLGGRVIDKTKQFMAKLGLKNFVTDKISDGLTGLGIKLKRIPLLGWLPSKMALFSAKLVDLVGIAFNTAFVVAIGMIAYIVVGVIAGAIGINLFITTPSFLATIGPISGQKGGKVAELLVPLKAPDINVPLEELPVSCPSGWPVTSGIFTQGPNGETSHYKYPGKAIDIANSDGSVGTSIYATHKGIAVMGIDPGGYGKYIDIHSNCNNEHIITRYGHLLDFEIKKNKEEVEARQLIGYMGSTGNSSGAHLHYEFRGFGNINDYLPKPVMPENCNLGTIDCETTLP